MMFRLNYALNQLHQNLARKVEKWREGVDLNLEKNISPTKDTQVQSLEASLRAVTSERDDLKFKLEDAKKEILLQENSKDVDLGSPVSSGDMSIEELELLLETQRHAAQLEISKWRDEAEGRKKAFILLILVIWSLLIAKWLYAHWKHGRVLN